MECDFFQELEQQLLAEKEIIVRGGLEAFQLLLSKFDQAADHQLLKYDRCNFLEPNEAIKIQTFRWMVKEEIPRILENIVNVNTPKDKPWSFREWMKEFAKP